MKALLLYHPESPGIKVPVVRNWWQRLLFPKDFATLSETLKYYKYCEAFKLLKMRICYMLSVAYLFENKLLSFPTSRQDNTSSCGATAVQSVLAYYGIDKRQDDLNKSLKISKDGISYKNIIEVLKRQDLKVLAGKMDIETVKNYINRDNPVIILIQAYSADKKYSKEDYNDGHYVVVIGYDDKHFIFEDPSLNNKNGYLPFTDLEIRWHGYGDTKNEKLINFGIAVVGKPKYIPGSIEKIK
jgi:predicted double-glycine peptidase